MEQILTALNGAWPVIQPAISGAFGAIVARLFLRGNTKMEEIEKIKQAKFAKVADALLEGGHITHLEYYKCRNFNKIAVMADMIYAKRQSAETADNTKNQSRSTEKQLNIDWFVRFFEEASNISDEQVQELWAKVLAGEVRQAGNFSLRTIDILKNLSKEEAVILQRIASYAIPIFGCYALYIDEELQNKYNYHNGIIRDMHDCGIIDYNIASHYDLTVNQAGGIFIAIGSIVSISHNQNIEKCSFDLQRFTKAGGELIGLMSPNNEYVIDFLKTMTRKFPNLSLTAHQIIEDNGTNFRYNPNSLLI
jgi:hypothetical protein